MNVYKKWKRVALFVCAMMVVSCVYIKFPAKAATVYPSKYTYIKPAPYWTSDPCDEFGTSQGVTILERDYNFFYVEYTRGGVKKRGYMSIDDITASGYSWCNHTEFNPGYNNTSSSVTVYYGPGTSYGVSGSIDANEGEVDSKPLLILGYNGSYAYVQYITNPNASTSTHKKFKRGWVLKSTITVTRPSASFASNSKYFLISSVSNDTYLTAVADSAAESGYSLKLQAGTGNQNQWWQLVQQTDATGAVYYKIRSVSCNKYLEVTGAIPVINTRIKLANLSSPNKAQEFYFAEYNSKIKTRCSGGYMGLFATGTDVYQHTAESLSSRFWTLHEMNTYWNGFYTNMQRDLEAYFDAPFFGNMTSDVVNSSIVGWNNIADVSITRTTSIASADIVFRGDNIMQPEDPIEEGVYYDLTGCYAQIEPKLTASSHFLINPSDSQYNSSWHSTLVRVNYNPDLESCLIDKDSNSIKYVLKHELGHTLKLQHPHGEEGWDIYSIMNTGLYNENGAYNPLSPSQYDQQVLKNKWGQ